MKSEIPKLSKPRRKFGKYIVLVLVILFLLWFFIPRPLSSEVKQQLATMEKLHATPSKAFVYLIGMDAPDDIDPMICGQKLLPDYVASNQSNENHPLGICDSQKNKQGYSKLFDGTPFTCSVSNDQNCISSLFIEKIERKSVVEQQSNFINRYQTLKSFNDFHQPYRMNVLGLIPPYKILFNGQKVYFLQQIELIDTHTIPPKTMQNNILRDLAYWRSELITADSLIHKMIVLALVRNDINMLSELNLRYGVAVPMISELTLSERSFNLVHAAETEFMLYNMPDLQYALDKCDAENQLLCKVKYVGSSFFYDHKDTVNMIAHSRALEFKQSTFPLPELFRNKNQEFESFGLDHWIRNSIGTVGAKMSLGIYLSYVFRVNNLNLQIALLNATANQPVGNKDPQWLKNIANPYGDAAGSAYIDQHGWLCFPDPMQDSHKASGCIPWLVSDPKANMNKG